MPGINETRPPGERIVHFGMHKGKRYKDVPDHYLRWMARAAFAGQSHKQGADAARRRWAKEELDRRSALSTTPKGTGGV